jgi:hypothetical protein
MKQWAVACGIAQGTLLIVNRSMVACSMQIFCGRKRQRDSNREIHTRFKLAKDHWIYCAN